MTWAMLRDDWWWPWWVSSLIDVGIAAFATAVFRASSRRAVRLIAGTVVLAAVVAAVMAPLVMSGDSDEPQMKMMGPNA